MSSGSGLPTPKPPISPEAEVYWQAASEGCLMLPRCRQCDTVIWYPRGICPQCHSTAIEWIEASGRGSVYSFSVARRGVGLYKECCPYVIAYVELEEGPRVLSNIVGCPPETVKIDLRVVATFDRAGKGSALVRFRPA